ncbi:putative galactosylceramide sulfotransferase-like [Apostichopus japonicus]|uniref:Putative galactosylceramide sulfotransferase-like n=1 Tax=Stichopus japonicus TaxID=307972 RepID=A0A2G8KBF4_STIJA|nr:putative galactosylceramide sulfotransferase-like [Apostichopus japonicus]
MLHNEKDVYNIFCHHTRFSQKIPQVMPVNTIYITIVRDPVKVFESAFIYFKMDYRLDMTNDPEALQKFLQKAQSFYDSTSNKVHMKNPMLFDMGVAIEDFNSEALVKKHIKTFHKRYRLVMVAEYFEESLILLRDLLVGPQRMWWYLNLTQGKTIVSFPDGKGETEYPRLEHGDVLLYEHLIEPFKRL